MNITLAIKKDYENERLSRRAETDPTSKEMVEIWLLMGCLARMLWAGFFDAAEFERVVV